MASRFVLTAQLQLRAPTNTRQVVNQIQQQLRGVNVQVNLQGGQQASRQVNNLNKATKQTTTQATKMGKAFGASIRRFGAFTIATRAVSLFTSSLANATKEAIAFEREMIKISQVTGKTMTQLKGLENTITSLSTSLGVSSKSILSVGRILSQAGIQAKDLEVALRTLAKTELAPTFDDITQTAEGAVAILAQFGEGVGALERQLGAINAVAGQFAVESGDLISAVRRTGGVFKAAGGDLNELIGLFTSVRATTRESAESIATGLRTIFTRIQRPATIEFLKQFGVELTDLNGKFVGPFEAIRQLSQALSGLEEGDIRFVRIAEELGGFRQIGKVIPLLQQFETAERARQAALEGGDSLTKDAATAQQALAVQIAKVKEEFLALIRSISQTASFQILVKTSLELASALIKIADALKPLIPLLTAFAAVKFARGAAGFARGIGAGLRGGSPTGFARGGMVPGTGNRDTVPAMLTPGEFVIRKSSVNKLGSGTLAAMNENGYAAGGVVTSGRNFYGNIRPTGGAKLRPELQKLSGTTPASTAAGTEFVDTKNQNRVLTILERAISKKADSDDFGAAFLRPFGSNVSLDGKTDPTTVNEEAQKLTSRLASLGITSGRARGPKPTLGRRIKGIIEGYNNKNKFRLDAGSLKKDQANSLEETLLSGIEKTIIDGAKQLNSKLEARGALETASILKSANVDQTLGNLFEGVLSFAGAPYGEKDSDAPNAPFDFVKGLGASLSGMFGLSRVSKRPTEAKSTFATKNIASISKKVENQNAAELRREVLEAFLSVAPQLTDFSAPDVKKLFGAKTEKDLVKSVPSAVLSKKGQQTRVSFRNSGGGISGSDTVPAMLTPGEFVFNKKAAQSIGYSNLNRMNKQGVQGFAKGGAVQKFFFGGRSRNQTLGGVEISDRLESAITGGDSGGRTGRSGGMDALGIMMAVSSIAAFIPQVEGATEGIGAMQNEVSNTVIQLSAFGTILSSLGLPMNKWTVSIGAAVGATFAFTKMIDAYTGVHEKAKKAIEEGNVAEAGAAAVRSKNASLANKASLGVAAGGAAVGTAVGTGIGALLIPILGPLGPALGSILGGVIGTVAGSLAGILTKIVLGMEALEPVLNFFRDNILTIFGADSTAVVKAKAEADASAARETKKLAEASKTASEAMKEVREGSKTIKEAFQSGALTGGISAILENNAVQLASSEVQRNQAVADARNPGTIASLFGIATPGGLAVKALRESGAAPSGVVPDVAVLADEIGAYIGIWEDSRTRTRAALAKVNTERQKQEEEFNKRLAEQLKSPEFKEAFNKLVKESSGTAAALGRTAPTLDSILAEMGEAGEDVKKVLDLNDELKKKFEQDIATMGKAAQENAAFLRSLNFGLKDVTSGITAFNTNLDNITESSKTGYNSLTIATNTLAAVVSGAGAAISQSDLDSSLNAVSNSFSAFGATAEQVDTLTGTLQGFNDAQVNANAALETLRSNLSASDIADGGNLGKVQDDFKAALLSTIPDSSPIKDRLKSAFNGIGDLTKEEIEQFYNTGDASPILQKVFGPLGEQIQKQILGPMKEMQSVNAKLIKATEERRKAELKLITAQKKAIENQIEAAKNLEFFGGDKFTPEKEFAARRQQANLSLQDVGVAGLTTGSADDIRRASQDVLTRFSRQQGAQNAAISASGGTRGAFGDRVGVETDRRPELKAANEALLTITKQSIAQRKEELELIKKKNQAEKNALDSLLGGDIESFFEQSIGAAAGSALRIGDAAAASLFGAGALGKGLQGLQGTGLSDAENKRASQLAFGAFGLGDRAASVFSGTTTEEERIKAEGRELSQLQSELGDQAANMESMDVTAKQVIINTQDAKFAEIQSRVNKNQALLRSRGGPIYASRGMFIPRGTDTVPAMLTPGEFVVNRAAVQRGNNLQILRSMNSNSAPIQATQALSSGGPVRYRANGSTGPEGPGGIDFSKFEEMVNKFQEVTDKLGNVNIKHMFEKLGTLDINHMFNGNMQQAFKDEILAEAGNMMSRSKFNSDGSITTSDRSVLG